MAHVTEFKVLSSHFGFTASNCHILVFVHAFRRIFSMILIKILWLVVWLSGNSVGHIKS